MEVLAFVSHIVRTGSTVDVVEVGRFKRSLQKMEPRALALARIRKARLLALQVSCRSSRLASGTGLAATVAKVQAKIGAKRMVKTRWLFGLEEVLV